jgi:murein DD-endopeptidase MepM/ murein hydrolase activator NlpD
MRRLSTFALLAALVLAPAAGAATPAAGATARAWAIRILVPGRAPVGTRMLSAPSMAHPSAGDAYAYPANGSIVRARTARGWVGTTAAVEARAGAAASVGGLSLFRGEIVAAAVDVRSRAVARPGTAVGAAGGSTLTGLVVLGRAVTPAANRQIPLGRWGYAITLEQLGRRVDAPGPGYHGFVTALDVFLTAPHGGLPAGSELQIGYAEADAQAARSAPLPPAPSEPGALPGEPGSQQQAVLARPLTVTPSLGQSGYVFPVAGASSFIDTFGAYRGDVPGGWHHGDDIFAAVGTPVVAVAQGTVFSVGWNPVGGWRLWLEDDRGNEFYYAHLSAYSPLAVDGERVAAGDVLGFVGDTGDAEGTPSHLHFEVHPVGLLGIGYDGAVDPTGYLSSWRRWHTMGDEAPTGVTADPPSSHTPPPAAAMRVSSSDISAASGLDPDSLRRAASGGSSVTRSRRQARAVLPVAGSPSS